MKYIQVKWIHEDPDDPVEIYSEIDDAQWEHRKVEVFRDGRKGFASTDEAFGDTKLGLEPWPDLRRLGAEPEFKISEITPQEFEKIWVEASCSG